MDFPIPSHLFGPLRLLDFRKISHPPTIWTPPFIKHQRVMNFHSWYTIMTLRNKLKICLMFWKSKP